MMFGWGRGGGGGVSAAVVNEVMRRSVAWYDFDPLDGVAFQEAAATTDADAPGEPLGAWLDRFRRDVPATQSTAGYRPLLGRTVKGGRKNIFTYSNDLSNAAWAKSNVLVTDDAVTSPDGHILWKVASDAATFTSMYRQVVATADSYTFSCIIKKGSGANDMNLVGIYNATSAENIVFGTVNLDTGVVTPSVGTGIEAEPVGTDTWLVTLTIEAGFSVGHQLNVYFGYAGGPLDAGVYSYIGEVQGEVGTSRTPFQVVVTDYDTTMPGAASLWYAAFDQVDDALAVTVPDLGSDAVVAYADESGVTILEGQTIDSSYPLITSERLFALAIWDDPLTEAEKSAVRSILMSLTEAI